MDTRTGIFACKKCRAHLHTFSPKGKSRDYSARIADTSGGYYGCRNSIYDLRRERKCSCKRILGGKQERAAMAPRFKARSHNDIDSGLVQNHGFSYCCRGSNRKDSLGTAFVQDLLRRHSDDEAEGRDLCIEQDAYLVFKLDGNIRLIVRQRRAQIFYMSSHMVKTSRELLPARNTRTFISIETHKFIAKGLLVSSRISSMMSLIAEALRPCA